MVWALKTSVASGPSGDFLGHLSTLGRLWDTQNTLGVLLFALTHYRNGLQARERGVRAHAGGIECARALMSEAWRNSLKG